MRDITYDEINLLTLKNIILVRKTFFKSIQAPFFEELIYRAVILNIFIEADVMSINKCVLILPIFFAIGILIFNK